MPSIPDNNAMQWETVGLPLAAGVDLRTPGRAISQQRLQKFENGRFADADAGLVRRRGHDAYLARVPGIIADVGNTQRAREEWVFGEGWVDGGIRAQLPDVGEWHGVAARDTEAVVWDGFRLFSWPEKTSEGNFWQEPCPAVLPSASTRPLAKSAAAQRTCDVGVGSHHAVVVWVDASTSTAYVSVYDAVTWAPLLLDKALDLANASRVRVVPAGEWVHVLASSSTQLKMYSLHKDSASNVRAGAAALPTCSTYFDARRCNANRWVLVGRRPAADGSTAWALYLRNDGTVDDTLTAGAVTLDTTGAGPTNEVGWLAVGTHRLTQELALAWVHATDMTKVYGAVYSDSGVRKTSRLTLNADAYLYGRITIEGEYVLRTTDAGGFKWFVDAYTGSTPLTVAGDISASTGVGAAVYKRYWTEVSHHAFRAGNLVFVGLRHTYATSDPDAPRLQYGYFLCDEELKPVGVLERGTAGQAMTGLPSVHADHDCAGLANQTRFHLPVVYRQRLDSEDNDQYDAESIKLGTLNFLPKLRTAQLGRTLYIAGAQLSQYDGQRVVEAGHLVFPEKVVVTDTGVAGNIKGKVRYRARWAWINAQGEEEVSAALTTDELDVGTIGRQIDVRVRTDGLTRKTGKYLLLYRNEGGDGTSTGVPGTQWYLVTSRDPSSVNYVENDPTVSTITFRDNTADSALIAFEKDRGDSGAMEPFPAPACEVIAAGRDRLWLAGGEIPLGAMQPSMLYTAGEVASFNTIIQTPVDQGSDPITAFGFMGLSTLVFRRARIHAFEADGPSNTMVGSFDYPRVIASDVGAVDQASVVLSTAGVYFQSPAGFKLVATNYQIVDVGAPVRPEAVGADIAAAVLVPDQREVRFYRRDGAALVFFYDQGEWGTWPGLEANGAVLTRAGKVLVARPDGRLWVEREGAWTDGGRGYEMVVRTASLNRGLMQGAQRVRRVAVLGDVFGPCTLSFLAYLDDSPSPADAWQWEVPGTDLNPNTLGSGATLGDAGYVGDFPSSGLSIARTDVLGDRHRLRVQKCARISIEIRDGAPNNAGVGLTELALELGARGGLNRLAPRTHTS